MISQEAYKEAIGTKCPLCESEDITGDSIEVHGNLCYQGISCSKCSASWTDRYVLDGYLDVLDPDGKDMHEKPPEDLLQPLVSACILVMPDLKHYVATHGCGPDKRLETFKAAVEKAM